MKNFGNGIIRLSTLTILIASLSTMGFASVQDASAMPGPFCILQNALVPPGSSSSWTCWGQQASFPHDNGVVVVYRTLDENLNADTTVSFPNGATGQCSGPGNIVVGGNGGADGLTEAFLLADTTGIAVPAADSVPNFWNIPTPTAGPTLPAAANEDSITVSFPDAGIISTTQNGAFSATLANTVWLQIGTSPNAPDTLLGAWTFETCVMDTGIGIGGGDFDGFVVQEPVGGEMLSINTSALLIAGLATSGMWIVPTIGAIAGIGIAAYKLRKNF